MGRRLPYRGRDNAPAGATIAAGSLNPDNDAVVGERRQLTPAEETERERLIEEDLRDME